METNIDVVYGSRRYRVVLQDDALALAIHRISPAHGAVVGNSITVSGKLGRAIADLAKRRAVARMSEIEANLRWACQALSLLNRDGFPSVAEAEAVMTHKGLSRSIWNGRLREAAAKIVDGTPHIRHPALDALAASLGMERSK